MPTQLTVNLSRRDVRTNSFRNQWMNFCLYLPQFMYVTKNNPNKNRVCGFLVPDKAIRLKGNDQPIGGGAYDTAFLANGNNYQTAFIRVDKRDLVNVYERVGDAHGFTSEALPTVYDAEYKSEYSGTNNQETQGLRYFFRGLLQADCLRFLREKNII